MILMGVEIVWDDGKDELLNSIMHVSFFLLYTVPWIGQVEICKCVCPCNLKFH